MFDVSSTLVPNHIEPRGEQMDQPPCAHYLRSISTSHPAGIRCVLVNGEVVVEDGRQAARHAGRVLRRSSP